MPGPGESPYYFGPPSRQSLVDVFAGQWASRLPGDLTAGDAGLFQDPRIAWAADRFAEFGLPVTGTSIVELGPLEGGHTTMLRDLGAAHLTAIEANRDAFLKCLVVKELFNLTQARFLFGDGVAHLRTDDTAYDLGIACGFLYHMVNPVEVIELLTRRCRAVFLWTVHHDPAYTAAHPDRPAGSGPAHQAIHAGFQHTLHRHDYTNGGDFKRFWGGPAPFAHWMERADILAAFAHFGFTRQVAVTENNPNGRALLLAATRE